MAPNVGRKVVTTGAQGTPGVRAYQTLQPLYSSVGLNNAALPTELTFFGYKQGDNVPGAGNAAGVRSTPFHTNMRLAGQLPRPQLFICEGIRLFVPLIAFTTTANTPEVSDAGFNATTIVDSDLFDSLTLLTYSSTFELQLGEKSYCDHPLFFFPANIGYAGIAEQSSDDVSASATQSTQISLPSTMGIGYQLYPFETIDGTRGPILVAEGQNIRGTMRCSWTTNPSMDDDYLLYSILDGQLTRAAQ